MYVYVHMCVYIYIYIYIVSKSGERALGGVMRPERTTKV